METNAIIKVGEQGVTVIMGIMIVGRLIVGLTKTKKDDRIFKRISKPIKALLGIDIKD